MIILWKVQDLKGYVWKCLKWFVDGMSWYFSELRLSSNFLFFEMDRNAFSIVWVRLFHNPDKVVHVASSSLLIVLVGTDLKKGMVIFKNFLIFLSTRIHWRMASHSIESERLSYSNESCLFCPHPPSVCFSFLVEGKR